MRLMRIALLVLVLGSLWGCASSAPTPRPAARPFDNVRRVAVVVTGDSRFTVLEHRAEPGKTFDAVLGWTPFKSLLQPFAMLARRAPNCLVAPDRAAAAGPAAA